MASLLINELSLQQQKEEKIGELLYQRFILQLGLFELRQQQEQEVENV